MEIQEVIHSDGVSNKMMIFPAETASRILLVCLPAMGVRASYYQTLAEHMSVAGFHAVTVDWRGHGHSSVRASRKVDFGYEKLVEDLHEIVAHVVDRFADTKVALVGHSLGGQIGSLFTARYPNLVSGLVLVTSGSVYYKGWDRRTANQLRFAGNVFYPLSKIIGYFPGNKLGFGGRESQTVMKDWCHNALTGTYQPAGSVHNYELLLAEVSKPILSISVEDDKLASEQAAKNLYNKFGPASVVSHHCLTSDQTNVRPLTHFSWAKNPEYFVRLIKQWTQENTV